MKFKFTLSFFIVGAYALCVNPTIISTYAVNAGDTAKNAPGVIEISPANRVSASPDIAVGPDGGINAIWVDKGEASAQAAPPVTGPQPGGHTHKTYNNLYFARSTDGG